MEHLDAVDNVFFLHRVLGGGVIGQQADGITGIESAVGHSAVYHKSTARDVYHILGVQHKVTLVQHIHAALADLGDRGGAGGDALAEAVFDDTVVFSRLGRLDDALIRIADGLTVLVPLGCHRSDAAGGGDIKLERQAFAAIAVLGLSGDGELIADLGAGGADGPAGGVGDKAFIPAKPGRAVRGGGCAFDQLLVVGLILLIGQSVCPLESLLGSAAG